MPLLTVPLVFPKSCFLALTTLMAVTADYHPNSHSIFLITRTLIFLRVTVCPVKNSYLPRLPCRCVWSCDPVAANEMEGQVYGVKFPGSHFHLKEKSTSLYIVLPVSFALSPLSIWNSPLSLEEQQASCENRNEAKCSGWQSRKMNSICGLSHCRDCLRCLGLPAFGFLFTWKRIWLSQIHV